MAVSSFKCLILARNSFTSAWAWGAGVVWIELRNRASAPIIARRNSPTKIIFFFISSLVEINVGFGLRVKFAEQKRFDEAIEVAKAAAAADLNGQHMIIPVTLHV